MVDYRKIWKNFYGEIPIDDSGRTYEIHHKDGNHSNNCIENLQAVTIKQHYKIHEENGDWGACLCIARRMKMPPEYLSEIQRNKPVSLEKRNKLSKALKGKIPWNKGKFWPQEIKDHWSKIRKGRVFSQKLTINQVKEIRNLFEKRLYDYSNIGKIGKNGKSITYEILFCKHLAEIYHVTPANIYRIVRRETWQNV